MKPISTIAWWKLNFAAAAGMAALLSAAAGTAAVAGSGSGDSLTAEAIVAKSLDGYAALSSYSDSGTVATEMAGQRNTLTFNLRLQRPNLYRVNWQGTALTGEGVAWSDGSGDFLQATAPGQAKDSKAQKMQNRRSGLARAAGLSWTAAATVPQAFFKQNLGDMLLAPATSGRYPLKKETDAKIGDADCYVVSGVMDLSQLPDVRKAGTSYTTLWIGKSDFLIRQARMRYVEKAGATAPPSDQAIDDAIKKSLEMQHKPATPEAIAAMRPQMREIMQKTQSTLKAGFAAGMVFTQTHQNIVVNQKLAPADFTR